MRSIIKALGPTLGFAFIATSAACGTSHGMHKGERLAKPNIYEPQYSVRITEIGDGDEDWNNRGSIIGVECKVGPKGLRNEWSDDFYEGDLVDCSNGMSYDFEYVKVETVPHSENAQP